ncbi:MAG: chitobiase/beta-hexosaminidase C-terminal domain-containing protein, partial [Phycisphaeraceae bacterium]
AIPAIPTACGFARITRLMPAWTALAAAVLLALAPRPADAQLLGHTNQITQYGITFTFDQDYLHGQFANGDYWVAADGATGVTVTSITPDFTGTRNGWMVNPSSPNVQGFASDIARFNAGVVNDLPYVAAPGSSLLKVISRGHWTGGDATRYSTRDVTRLETASVLTVVDTMPDTGGERLFRPAYGGSDKTLYSVDDLRTDLLPSLAPSPSTPTLANQERRFERVQIEFDGSWQGRQMRPMQHMPDYGAQIGRDSGGAALRLMLNDSIEDREQLLVNYVQYGLDLYADYQSGTRWPGNGGHALGRKLPMVFAAVMLDHEQMKQDIMNAPQGHFHENDSVYFSENAMTSLWGHTGSESMYWLNQHTTGGSRTVRDPYGYIDGGQQPGGSYQFCCNSMPFKGAALALHLMPELREVWNDEKYLDYVDRWVTHGAWTDPDPYQSLGDGAQDGVGRYPELHGTNADSGSYGSSFVNAMWDQYRDGPVVLMPFIAPFDGGEFEEPVTVELLAPHQDDVQIRYTLDGSIPTEASPLYEGLFQVGPGDHTLRVRGFKDGHHASAINSVDLSIALVMGDMNLDGVVDAVDVAPFVLALTNPADYLDQYGVAGVAVGDVNGDGTLDAVDVAPFVQMLVGEGDPISAPEPGTLSLLALGGVLLVRRRR